MSNQMVYLVVATTLILVCPSLVFAADLEHPGGLHTRDQIEMARAAVAASQQPWKAAYDALMEEAVKALDKAPEAVEDFNVPGFYQDADGHRNALRTLAHDAWAAYACAVAWQLTPGEARLRYADKAVEVLDAWALTNTRQSGYDGSLVMAYAGVGLVFAAELVTDYDGWSEVQRERFSGWVMEVFLPTSTGIADRSNNWGDWGLLGSIAARHFLDDGEGIDADITRLRQKIADCIAPDGSMPHETRREKRGLWYTYFALAPLTAACQVALNARGVDLFHYRPEHGAGLKEAHEYFFYYCRHPEEWPHHSEDDLAHAHPSRWPGNLFEAMSGIYDNPDYAAYVAEARPLMVFGHHYAWAMPTLLRTAPPPGNTLRELE